MDDLGFDVHILPSEGFQFLDIGKQLNPVQSLDSVTTFMTVPPNKFDYLIRELDKVGEVYLWFTLRQDKQVETLLGKSKLVPKPQIGQSWKVNRVKDDVFV